MSLRWLPAQVALTLPSEHREQSPQGPGLRPRRDVGQLAAQLSNEDYEDAHGVQEPRCRKRDWDLWLRRSAPSEESGLLVSSHSFSAPSKKVDFLLSVSDLSFHGVCEQNHISSQTFKGFYTGSLGCAAGTVAQVMHSTRQKDEAETRTQKWCQKLASEHGKRLKYR